MHSTGKGYEKWVENERERENIDCGKWISENMSHLSKEENRPNE